MGIRDTAEENVLYTQMKLSKTKLIITDKNNRHKDTSWFVHVHECVFICTYIYEYVYSCVWRQHGFL